MFLWWVHFFCGTSHSCGGLTFLWCTTELWWVHPFVMDHGSVVGSFVCGAPQKCGWVHRCLDLLRRPAIESNTVIGSLYAKLSRLFLFAEAVRFSASHPFSGALQHNVIRWHQALSRWSSHGVPLLRMASLFCKMKPWARKLPRSNKWGFLTSLNMV